LFGCQQSRIILQDSDGLWEDYIYIYILITNSIISLNYSHMVVEIVYALS